jgi:hypothetical protein
LIHSLKTELTFVDGEEKSSFTYEDALSFVGAEFAIAA